MSSEEEPKNDKENDNSEFYIFSCYELLLKGKDGRVISNNPSLTSS